MKINKLITAAFVILTICSACGDSDKLGQETPLAPPYALPERGESEAGDRIIDFSRNTQRSCFMISPRQISNGKP